MGISKKGKRKIVVDGAEYYWCIADDFEVIDLGTDKSLTVVTGDKKFLARYPVRQNGDGENLLVVLGKVFGGAGEWGNTWQRVKCAKWEIDGKITPAVVEKIIRWSLSEKRIELLDYRGNKL
jgi:hypothetical protein